MNLHYRFPPAVQLIDNPPRACLTTPQGGRVVVDTRALALWRQAFQDGSGVVNNVHTEEASLLETRAALACLAEAGLLIRDTETRAHTTAPSVVSDAVSVIIVTYNSAVWLEPCLASLVAQTCPPLEIIVVDNASSDHSADWVATHFPDVKLIRLIQQQSLAHAINRGVAIACGDYFLILNPDVTLMPDAIAQMVAVVRAEPMCAAVAPKLCFSWAPGFLNGIGNHVGAFSWAADNGLGHLDLGQFDVWREVPSACFAAALVSRVVWEKVGALDEGFPLYYEDLEWCYRARLLGYTVRTAPQAIVYHAFGARVPTGDQRGMSPQKLRNVVYGRLRFAVKLLRPLFLMRFVLAYAIEDGCRFLFALLRLDTRTARAYCNAWYDFLLGLPALLHERQAIQARRARTDRELFDLQKKIPAPLMWHGVPELTWDLIRNHYLPLILAGKTRALPEFADVDMQKAQREFVGQGLLARAYSIWHTEGLRVLLHRLGRYLQWRFALI